MIREGKDLSSVQRDERVQETAMLYGVGPLQEAAAKQGSEKNKRSTKPSPRNLGSANTFHSVKGWTPQVNNDHHTLSLCCCKEIPSQQTCLACLLARSAFTMLYTCR